MNDPALMLGLAFVLGYLVRQLGLPPLIGFLAAGFMLRGVWAVELTESFAHIADLGVTLMLFTIGLKLEPKKLAQTPVWLGSSLHLVLCIALFTPLLLAGGALGLPLLDALDAPGAALVAFALAFSSTVFAVIVFQTKDETGADYAKTAIAILIMQDIYAVVFMTVSKGAIPSPWALLVVVALLALRGPLRALLERSGHGELLLLSGLLLPLIGYEMFEIVHLKGDLGALFLGVLLAGSAKAEELSDLLFGFKELLLVAFFLSIGLRGDPSLDMVLIALALVILLPVKTALFYALLTRLGVAARPATFATLGLSNYSEFALIVGGVAAKAGWISPDWLLVFALALSVTYVIAAPASMRAEALFERFASFLHRFERPQAIAPPPKLRSETLLIVGMGRLGRALYARLEAGRNEALLGIDFDANVVTTNVAEGRRCIGADGTDHAFWRSLELSCVRAVLLTTPNPRTDLDIIESLRESGYRGYLVASTTHADEAEKLRAAGADAAYSVYHDVAVALGDMLDEELGESALHDTSACP